MEGRRRVRFVEREAPAAPKPLDHVFWLAPGSPVARAGGYLAHNCFL